MNNISNIVFYNDGEPQGSLALVDGKYSYATEYLFDTFDKVISYKTILSLNEINDKTVFIYLERTISASII